MRFHRLILSRSALTLTIITALCFGVHSVPVQAAVVINEFLAVNSSSLQDEDGDNSDWIELLNTGTTTVSLAGWHLTDDAT